MSGLSRSTEAQNADDGACVWRHLKPDSVSAVATKNMPAHWWRSITGQKMDHDMDDGVDDGMDDGMDDDMGDGMDDGMVMIQNQVIDDTIPSVVTMTKPSQTICWPIIGLATAGR